MPYIELWDLKPPLIFAYFAIILKVFGKSLFAIRFITTFLIALSSYFIYRIGKHTANYITGVSSALLCIIVPNLFYSDLCAAMSEYITMAFFIPGLWLLIKSKKKYVFLAGFLFGNAVMIRLNMAYPVFLLIIWLFFYEINRNNLKKKIIFAVKVSLGIIFPISILVGIYMSNGYLHIFWDSVVKAPLAYNVEGFEDNIRVLKNSLPFLAWGLLSFLLLYKEESNNRKRTKLIPLFVVSVGVLFSFIHSGKFYTHYLIQLYPFLFLMTMPLLCRWKGFKFLGYLFFIGCLISFFISTNYDRYKKLYFRMQNHQEWLHGSSIEVSNYIKNNYEYNSAYFVTDHLGYWFLNIKPPTKLVAHPDNIKEGQSFLYNYVYEERKNSYEGFHIYF